MEKKIDKYNSRKSEIVQFVLISIFGVLTTGTTTTGAPGG